MSLSKAGSLIAFTAFFAVLAILVFWGSWALDVVPVMPDAQTSFSADHAGDFICKWLESGKFVPGDAINFIGSPYFWVELQYVLALYCSALAMAYFLRGRGVGRFPSYASGALLAFSGYWVTLFSAGHLGWFQWMTYGVFAFALADRVVAKGRLRHCVLLGATLAWGSFYQPDMWLLFTVFTAAYFAFRSAVDWPGLKPWLLRGSIALLVFVAVGLPSFRSAFVNDLSGRDGQIDRAESIPSQLKDSEEKRWIFATNWSMPPEDTLEFYRSGIHGHTSCPLTLAINSFRGREIKPYTGRLGRPYGAEAGNYRQHSLYVGSATCLFALLGALFAFSGNFRREVVFFSVCAVVFWVFSMGRYCEAAYRIVYALPFGDYLRAPVKWHHLTEFCLVALAAFGLEGALRLLKEPFVRFGRIALAGVVFFAALELALHANLFCAPHTADTVIAPLQKPFPPDPVAAGEYRRMISAEGLKLAGELKAVFRVDGALRELAVPVVEKRIGRPAPRDPRDVKPLEGAARFFAFLSLFATVATAAYALAASCSKRIDAARIK